MQNDAEGKWTNACSVLHVHMYMRMHDYVGMNLGCLISPFSDSLCFPPDSTNTNQNQFTRNAFSLTSEALTSVC